MKSKVLALILVVGIQILSQISFADFIEIGGAGNYRKSNIDSGAFDENSSLTASLSYIFDEMSALELSYTNGYSKRFIGANLAKYDHTTTVFYELIGLDLVITLGSSSSALRPYVKGGVAYLAKKRLVDQFQGFDATVLEDQKGFVPSAGIGLKLSLTKSLSIKAGIEAWTSRPLVGGDSNPDLDVAGRAGVSWLF